MTDFYHISRASDRLGDTTNELNDKLWADLKHKDLASILSQFMKKYRLSVRDIASMTLIQRSAVHSMVRRGQFTLGHVNSLLTRVREGYGMADKEYRTWRKAFFMAAFLQHKRGSASRERQSIWDTKLMKDLSQALSQAYEKTHGFAVYSGSSLADFAKAWEKKWSWIRAPKRYQITRIEKHGYDLESTLPLAMEIKKIRDLGPNLRVESKGWGTGAYRVYRISTKPLGDPRDFEPELVHIPAGEFWMCKLVKETDGETSYHVEPSHKIYLDEFWISRYPVTVAEFAYFVDHYGHFTSVEERQGGNSPSWRQPNRGEHRDIREYGRHPVTMVSKADAQAYCRWLSEVTGKTYSLPTKEQWEKAAFGTDARMYPWGNSEPNRTLCNVEHWYNGTTPVGQFSPAGDGPRFDNKHGCADMIGNVSEWTLDTYKSTSAIHPDCDPDFYYYKTRTYEVACGTSWRMGRLSRSNNCTYGDARDHVGFRVVVHLPI